MVLSLLPDGRTLKRQCAGWVVSCVTWLAFHTRHVSSMSWKEGRGTPMILSADRTMHCRDRRKDAVQLPHHTVRQLVKTLSMMPL